MCVVENTRCEAFPSAAQGSPSPATGIARERRFVSEATHTIRIKSVTAAETTPRSLRCAVVTITSSTDGRIVACVTSIMTCSSRSGSHERHRIRVDVRWAVIDTCSSR